MIKRTETALAFSRKLAVVFLFAAAGCAGNGFNLNLMNADELYAMGVEAYEAGNHQRAIILLERLVSQFIGDPRVPEARMLLGQAHMARREYATAATHFQRLVVDFPSHPEAIQARFLICESYYRLSPKPPLDQEYTLSAIEHCRSVAEYYPDTEQGGTAAEYVEELREKLARKVFNAGVQYFKLRVYDAAVVYFRDVVEQYPDTPVAPEALEQLVETYTRMGYVEDAEEAREQLLREYPQSPSAQAMRS